MNFLHYSLPQPIIFTLGPLTFHWYGLMIALALLLAILVAGHLAKRRGLKFDSVLDLGFWLAVGGILGARLYEVFILDWFYYQHNLLAIFKIWQGGLAIHGAIIGGIIVINVWSRKNKPDLAAKRRGIWAGFLVAVSAPPTDQKPTRPHPRGLPRGIRGDSNKISFWQIVDLAAPALALGQSIGRWGNYFNQELFGWPTNLPWGIPIEPKNRPENFLANQYFQPTFLYESILDFILFLILFFLAKKSNYRPGSLLAVYLLGYGLIRFLMEFVRIDETLHLAGLRWPQWISLVLILTGLLVYFLYSRRQKKGSW